MIYKVEIHPAAEQVVSQLFEYIAESSVEGAIRRENAFAELKSRLSANPLMYGYTPEEYWLEKGLRSAPFSTARGNT